MKFCTYLKKKARGDVSSVIGSLYFEGKVNRLKLCMDPNKLYKMCTTLALSYQAIEFGRNNTLETILLAKDDIDSIFLY